MKCLEQGLLYYATLIKLERCTLGPGQPLRTPWMNWINLLPGHSWTFGSSAYSPPLASHPNQQHHPPFPPTSPSCAQMKSAHSSGTIPTSLFSYVLIAISSAPFHSNERQPLPQPSSPYSAHNICIFLSTFLRTTDSKRNVPQIS